MSIPTHNLYEFVHQQLKNQYWIKYFYPWGSKDLSCLVDMFPYKNDDIQEIEKEFGQQLFCKKIFSSPGYKAVESKSYQPVLICHDQEPLNYDFYLDQNLDNSVFENHKKLYGYAHTNLNLRHAFPESFQKHWILLHSELNSKQVEKYEDSGKFACAYWWGHAIIARDWYRFAQYDSRLDSSLSKKKFLIYCRDTTGSRQYRQTFLSQIKSSSLVTDCQIGSFDSTYTDISSDSSAIYNVTDHCNTDISIVLETIFDERIHLTEKTLRPIACGHPFILASGPGSLEYLRSYGFKTFSPWIDESYDSIQNAEKRLSAIVDEMHRISNLSQTELSMLLNECKDVTKHNKKIFYSNNFIDQVVSELKNNVSASSAKDNYNLDYNFMWKYYKNNRLYKKQSLKRFTQDRPYVLTLIKHLKKGGTLENYVPPDLD